MMTLKEAWQIVDLNYGNLEKVCTNMKEKLMSIKLKATNDAATEVKLFDKV